MLFKVDDVQCCCVGRNENAQLGQGDTARRDVPTLVDGLTGLNIVRVACGKAHTLFLTGMLLPLSFKKITHSLASAVLFTLLVQHIHTIS